MALITNFVWLSTRITTFITYTFSALITPIYYSVFMKLITILTSSALTAFWYESFNTTISQYYYILLIRNIAIFLYMVFTDAFLSMLLKISIRKNKSKISSMSSFLSTTIFPLSSFYLL